MKVKVIERERLNMGDLSTIDLLENKVYTVMEISPKMKWFKILDESGEDYLYPPELFEVVEE